MIERWLEGLSGKETIGFDFNPVNRLLFRGLVEGSDMEDLLARLRAELSEASSETHRDRLLDHAKQMARSELFYPLKIPLARGGLCYRLMDLGPLLIRNGWRGAVPYDTDMAPPSRR